MADALTPGDLIDGRFRIERVLGEGGMGQVFEATQLSVERRVAIKTIRDQADSPVGRERFFREAKALSSLNHPGVVQLVDFGRDDESSALWLAMEFIEGLPLSTLLSLGRVRVGTALEIARQMASALSEAHARGIVHRDLKPDNVMLRTGADGRLQVKLVDFGIALPTSLDKSKLTQTGAVAGTPYYMSPEQAQALEVGPASDLYSLGVILFEMLAGQRPFRADTPLAVMFKHVNEPAPRLAEVTTLGLASEVEHLVSDLLEKTPGERPVSAEEVGDRIDEIGPGRVVATPNATSLAEFLPLVVEPTAAADVPTDSQAGAFDATLDSSSQNDESPIHDAELSQPLQESAKAGSHAYLWAVVLGLVAVILAVAIYVVNDRSEPSPPPKSTVANDQTSSVEAPSPAEEDRASVEESHRVLTEAQARTIALDLSAESNTFAWELSRRDDKAAPPPRARDSRPKPDKKADSQPAAPAGTSTFVPDTSKAALKAGQATLGFYCVGDDKCETIGSEGKGSAVCSDNSTCKADCRVGGCLQRCTGNADCDFECTGGGCPQFCGTTGSCKTSCKGGNCVEMEY